MEKKIKQFDARYAEWNYGAAKAEPSATPVPKDTALMIRAFQLELAQLSLANSEFKMLSDAVNASVYTNMEGKKAEALTRRNALYDTCSRKRFVNLTLVRLTTHLLGRAEFVVAGPDVPNFFEGLRRCYDDALKLMGFVVLSISESEFLKDGRDTCALAPRAHGHTLDSLAALAEKATPEGLLSIVINESLFLQRDYRDKICTIEVPILTRWRVAVLDADFARAFATLLTQVIDKHPGKKCTEVVVKYDQPLSVAALITHPDKPGHDMLVGDISREVNSMLTEAWDMNAAYLFEWIKHAQAQCPGQYNTDEIWNMVSNWANDDGHRLSPESARYAAMCHENPQKNTE
jgi:hypothetical protein